MRESSGRERIDLSFRMWSDHIPLRQLVEDAGFHIKHLHVANLPIVREGRTTKRIAPRHYASTAQEDAHDDAHVASWCGRILDRVKSHAELARLLRSRQIEGLMWMALLGGREMRLPQVLDDVIAACQAQSIGIFIEDYTAASGDIPVKHWIVSTPWDSKAVSSVIP